MLEAFDKICGSKLNSDKIRIWSIKIVPTLEDSRYTGWISTNGTNSGGLGCVAPLGTKIFPASYATVIKRPGGEGGFFQLSSETAIYLNICFYNFFSCFYWYCK